ncbi:hypothetical protein IEQ34_007852 [Dendrobium chrysotoxum]|uniref:Uncharacterized protein n=1 Tax=Dendrobium chrysotoxum TaxID=161865 RepID=A0AAV7H4Z5_DENCH|nr:hypothetical protein IEQ34_007852 [Dendrobium chrysotoxum]
MAGWVIIYELFLIELGPFLSLVGWLFGFPCWLFGFLVGRSRAKKQHHYLRCWKKEKAKEKTLELFSKICGHPGITEMELDRFKGLLLNIDRKDDRLKNKAENILKDLV